MFFYIALCTVIFNMYGKTNTVSCSVFPDNENTVDSRYLDLAYLE